jgi:hypothetical protein
LRHAGRLEREARSEGVEGLEQGIVELGVETGIVLAIDPTGIAGRAKGGRRLLGRVEE